MVEKRVTREDVLDNMQEVLVRTVEEFGKPTTYVTVRMLNGFTVRESTTCVDPQNYNEEIGKQVCLKKIEDKIWLLLRYTLQENIHIDKKQSFIYNDGSDDLVFISESNDIILSKTSSDRIGIVSGSEVYEVNNEGEFSSKHNKITNAIISLAIDTSHSIEIDMDNTYSMRYISAGNTYLMIPLESYVRPNIDNMKILKVSSEKYKDAFIYDLSTRKHVFTKLNKINTTNQSYLLYRLYANI